VPFSFAEIHNSIEPVSKGKLPSTEYLSVPPFSTDTAFPHFPGTKETAFDSTGFAPELLASESSKWYTASSLIDGSTPPQNTGGRSEARNPRKVPCFFDHASAAVLSVGFPLVMKS